MLQKGIAREAQSGYKNVNILGFMWVKIKIYALFRLNLAHNDIKMEQKIKEEKNVSGVRFEPLTPMSYE